MHAAEEPDMQRGDTFRRKIALLGIRHLFSLSSVTAESIGKKFESPISITLCPLI